MSGYGPADGVHFDIDGGSKPTIRSITMLYHDYECEGHQVILIHGFHM